MSITSETQLTGTFTDGAFAFAYATVVLELVSPGGNPVNTAGASVPLRYTFYLDGNGTLPGTSTIWTNDAILPAGSFYVVRVYTPTSAAPVVFGATFFANACTVAPYVSQFPKLHIQAKPFVAAYDASQIVGATTGNVFLNATTHAMSVFQDGSWQSIGGGGISQLTGDVTAQGSGSVPAIVNAVHMHNDNTISAADFLGSQDAMQLKYGSGIILIDNNGTKALLLASAFCGLSGQTFDFTNYGNPIKISSLLCSGNLAVNAGNNDGEALTLTHGSGMRSMIAQTLMATGAYGVAIPTGSETYLLAGNVYSGSNTINSAALTAHRVFRLNLRGLIQNDVASECTLTLTYQSGTPGGTSAQYADVGLCGTSFAISSGSGSIPFDFEADIYIQANNGSQITLSAAGKCTTFASGSNPVGESFAMFGQVVIPNLYLNAAFFDVQVSFSTGANNVSVGSATLIQLN